MTSSDINKNYNQMKCTFVQPSLHPKIIEEGRVNLESVEFCLQIDCSTAGKNQSQKNFIANS